MITWYTQNDNISYNVCGPWHMRCAFCTGCTVVAYTLGLVSNRAHKLTKLILTEGMAFI
jgi:hypothetical protein